MRLRRWLLLLSALAAAWAVAVAITGGFVLRVGSLRLSSRRWQVAAIVALISAAAVWMGSTRDERREAWRRIRDWRHWPRWVDAAVGLALVGAALRIALWAAGRPLWLDEEMIALNVRDRTMGQLSGALWLGQTAPLGWLALQRAMLVVWGPSELALRAVPLAFGLATVATAVWVGQRWMSRLGAAALVGLCAFGPWLIFNSVELKPYSADAFWGLLLPVLAAWAMEDGPGGSTTRTRRIIAWWLAASVGHWFANGALLVTPACAVVLCLAHVRRDGRAGAARVALPGLLWLASFGLHYLLAIRHAVGSDYLAGYWAFAMPGASTGVVERLTWVAGRLEPLAGNPGGSRLWVLFWLLAAGGFTLGSTPALGAMLAAVPLSAFALAALRQVPLFERLSLWVLPALYVGIALGVDRAFHSVTRDVRRRRWMPAVTGLAITAAGAAVCADVIEQGAGYLQFDRAVYARGNHQLDDRAAVTWLLEHQKPGDVLVTTKLAVPAIWWYADVAISDSGGAGQYLPDSSPILIVGHEPWRAECRADDFRSALSGRQRALVYLGFRFDDVPTGFDQALIETLEEFGPVVASRDFAEVGRALVVEIVRQPAAGLARRGLRPSDAAGQLSGCLTVGPAHRW